MDAIEIVQARLRERAGGIKIKRDEPCDLSQIAFAFPRHLKTYEYTLERSADREPVGFVVGRASYCAVWLYGGTTFDFRQDEQTPDATIIRHNQQIIGISKITATGGFWRQRYPNRFEISVNDKPWAVVERPAIVSGPLYLQRRVWGDGGQELPLKLHRENQFRAFVIALSRLMTLAFLYTPPPVNRDLVIPLEARERLTKDEYPLYFALAVLFRAVYFGNEYGCRW